jgi:hypothetical protein
LRTAVKAAARWRFTRRRFLDWLGHDAEPRRHAHERFAQVAGLVCAALRRIGVDARVGVIPGEYCAGQCSVNFGGARKVTGLAQRVYPRAAYIGGARSCRSVRLREVLVPVYEALTIAWEPATVGSVATEVSAISGEQVADALVTRSRGASQSGQT